MEKQDLRIVFMGTPDFAVASLKAIVENGYDVVGVITAPDKEAGRGKKLRYSAVKEFALKHKLHILQPEKLKNKEFLKELSTLNANLQVVVAFRMLPEEVWNMPDLGTFNLHASLLPQYRGAAPINHAIIKGEKITGLTTFFLDKEIDTGRIIDRVKVNIGDEDNFETLHDRMMKDGAKLVVETIEKIKRGSVTTIDQNDLTKPGDTFHPAPKIFKDFCQVNWHKNSKEIYDFIRGLSPYPCAYSYIDISGDQPILTKIFKSAYDKVQHNNKTGKVYSDEKTYIKVAVNDGYVYIQELQIPGKKRLLVEDFLRGFHHNILSFSKK